MPSSRVTVDAGADALGSGGSPGNARPQLQAVENGGQGGADHEVVVAIAGRDGPAEDVAGAVEDFVGGGAELGVIVGGDGIGRI